MATTHPAAEKMVPTSLKLPAALKAQIDDIARKAGVSAHAFMVKTLSDAAERSRQREQFTQDSLAALREVEETGLSYDWDEVKTYLKARSADRSTPRPQPKAHK